MNQLLARTDAHEGPVYVAAEGALYFTTQRAGRRVDIMRLSLDDGRISTVLADAAAANGMTLDHDGRLIVCEQQPAAISRVDPATGERELVVDAYRGLPLNSPNDVVVKGDGTVWFTDPSYGFLQGFRPAPASHELNAQLWCSRPGLSAVLLNGVRPNSVVHTTSTSSNRPTRFRS